MREVFANKKATTMLEAEKYNGKGDNFMAKKSSELELYSQELVRDDGYCVESSR